MLCPEIVLIHNVVSGNRKSCCTRKHSQQCCARKQQCLSAEKEKKYLPIVAAALSVLSVLSALSCRAVKLSWKEPWVKKRMVWSWPAALHPVGSNVTYVINLMVFFNADVLIIKCRFKRKKWMKKKKNGRK